jgi:ankyrin repeat protein
MKKGFHLAFFILILAGCRMEADMNGLNDAAYHGNLQEVQELLENGENPNGKGWDGDTPLANAIRGRNLEIVKILLENGADTKNEFVLEAIHKSKDEPIRKTLNEYKARQ